MKRSTKSIWAKIAVFFAALIWGSSFVVMKNAVEEFPSFCLLAIRFLGGALLLSLVFRKKWKQVNKSYFLQGGIAGAVFFLAYLFQTTGLLGTTPGKNAFLTDIYCLVVPFLYWIFNKKKPEYRRFFAALVCLVGIGFVTLEGDFAMGRGDFLTLIGGVFFSVHIVLLDRFGREKDPILLTIMQFLSAGICAVVASVFTEIPFSLSEISFETWLRISYLFLFCTTIAVLLQTVGQKYASPMSVGIILSFESVFGVVFSVAFYGEQLTLKVLIGFLLIFGAVFLSEIRFKKDKIKLTSLKKAHIIKSSGR